MDDGTFQRLRWVVSASEVDSQHTGRRPSAHARQYRRSKSETRSSRHPSTIHLARDFRVVVRSCQALTHVLPHGRPDAANFVTGIAVRNPG